MGYRVTIDGNPASEMLDTEDDARVWIQKHQPQSVYYAIRWGGFDIVAADEEESCDHVGTGRVRKYDGGRCPLLCKHCYTIVGTWADGTNDDFKEA